MALAYFEYKWLDLFVNTLFRYFFPIYCEQAGV